MDNLLEKLIKSVQLDSEKYTYFLQRTKKHITLAQEAVVQLVDKFPEYTKLLDIVLEHDKSKFEEPEVGPYIEMTWLRKTNPKYKPTPEIIEAITRHCNTEKHHPEYWTEAGVEYRSTL